MNLCNHCLISKLFGISEKDLLFLIKNIKLERDVKIKRWINNIEKLEYKK